MRGIRLLLAALAAVTVLCICFLGCSSSNELYERLIINSIGVDTIPEGYKVTLRCAEKSGGDDEIYEGKGRSVREAVDSITLTTGHKPFYSHNRLVVFGRECCEDGIWDALDFFSRNSEMAAQAKVAMSDSEAADVLTAEKEGKSVSMDELDSLSKSGDYSGMTAERSLVEFINSGRREGGSAYAPVFKEEDGMVSVSGTVFFRDFVFQGELSLEQTRGLLALTKGIDMGTAVVEVEDIGKVALAVRSDKPAIELSVGEDGPSFKIDVQMSSTVKSVSDHKNTLTEEDYAQIKQALSQQIKEEAESAVKTAMTENGCDVFGFGNMVYHKDPAYWKRNSDLWDELMRSLEINVEVESGISSI